MISREREREMWVNSVFDSSNGDQRKRARDGHIRDYNRYRNGYSEMCMRDNEREVGRESMGESERKITVEVCVSKTKLIADSR